MRRTLLERRGGERITIRSDDHGTMVLDAASRVLEQHGTDRHEEALDRYRTAGWRVTADGAARPSATGTQQPAGIAGDAGASGPAATFSDGEDG